MPPTIDRLKRLSRYAAVAGIVVFFFGFLFLFAVPGYPTMPFWVVLVLSAGAIASFIVLNRELIVRFFALRTVRKAVGSSVYLIIIIAILVAAYMVASNFPLRFDLTRGKLFTLSARSEEVLKLIKGDMIIIVFRSPAEDPSSAAWKADQLLKQYAARNKKIRLKYIDPNQDPIMANKLEVTEAGEMIFVYRGRKTRVLNRDLAVGDGSKATFVGEERLTQAIYSLVESYKLGIYFTAGHDEYRIDDKSEQGYSIIRNFLESENYDVRTLETAKAPELPANAALIVIAGPKRAFNERELGMLSRYLKSGGRLLALYDPFGIQNNNCNLDALLAEWGFLLPRDFVVDPAHNSGNPVYIVPGYGTHPSVASLKERNMPVCLFLARSVKASTVRKGGAVMEMLRTPDGESWAETDLASDTPRFNAGDSRGPITVGATAVYPLPGTSTNGSTSSPTATNDVKETRIAVIGDSDFAMNQALSGQYQYGYVFTGNKDLFLNTISYLLKMEHKISIRPKGEEEKRLTLTSGQTNFLIVFVQIIIPLLFAIAGAIVWFMRRK
ncbi:MAG: GldG family protein [Spirochaetota bacterium]